MSVVNLFSLYFFHTSPRPAANSVRAERLSVPTIMSYFPAGSGGYQRRDGHQK